MAERVASLEKTAHELRAAATSSRLVKWAFALLALAFAALLMLIQRGRV